MTHRRGLKRIWIPKSDEAENDSFETIAPGKENPVRKEFEIGQLGNEQLREDRQSDDGQYDVNDGNA